MTLSNDFYKRKWNKIILEKSEDQNKSEMQKNFQYYYKTQQQINFNFYIHPLHPKVCFNYI